MHSAIPNDIQNAIVKMNTMHDLEQQAEKARMAFTKAANQLRDPKCTEPRSYVIFHIAEHVEDNQTASRIMNDVFTLCRSDIDRLFELAEEANTSRILYMNEESSR